MNIALVGYGRMGKMIEQIAISKGHNISFRIDISNINDLDLMNPSNTDVAIEFSSPHSALNNVVKCFEQGVNVVCGSTGWNSKLPEAQSLAKGLNLGFLWSSNFSIGVNLFFKLNQVLAKYMNGIDAYTPSMTEIHHIHKKDAPSGTAITLAEGIIENYPAKTNWKLGENVESTELPIVAIREGEVPGTHIIKYESSVDSIEISHIAKSREGFALGAVVAAEFLYGKNGIFSMNDVLAI
jgi:4-hydroxy-tetrahydrodipicolinate reductase